MVRYITDVPTDVVVPKHIIEIVDKINIILLDNGYNIQTLTFIPKENSGLEEDRFCLKIYSKDPYFKEMNKILIIILKD